MQSKVLSIIILTFLIFQTSEKDVKTLIRDSINLQLKTYPLSQLRDLYKSFFQDRFGPGHLITNISSADEYLKYELKTAKTFKNAYYEYCGYMGNLLRVNLRILHENLIMGLNKVLYNFEEDDNYIYEILSKGEYQMSHSKRYDDAYEPHYRIIEKNIFNKEILPYIEGK